MEFFSGLAALALLPGAYVLGSIPFGLIIAQGFGHADIRTEGSGNIGATNVRRAAGNFAGLLTLIADALKGALPVWLAGMLYPVGRSGWSDAYIGLVALSALGGHLYPLFLRGRTGGKGVATAAGGLMAMTPAALAVSLLAFITAICSFNRVSAASLLTTALLPLIVWKATDSRALVGWAFLTFVLVAWRHRANIVRLANGTEPRIWDE